MQGWVDFGWVNGLGVLANGDWQIGEKAIRNSFV